MLNKKISIIGNGNVGRRLRELLEKNKYDVTIGVRNENKTKDLRVKNIEDAIKESNIIILAIPFKVVEESLKKFEKLLEDKVIIDATNPLNDDWSPLELRNGISAGEYIASLFPKSKIVKSFQMIFADIMSEDKLNYNNEKATVFISTDDIEAGNIVKEIADSIGMSGVLTGTLKASRYTEAMAHLNIQLAVSQGKGTNSGFIYFAR